MTAALGVAGDVETPAGQPAVDPAPIEQLRLDIQKILDDDGIPGASVALVTGDHTIWAGGVGKADIAADVDVTADTLFRVGSISKSFTALAVLTLVEQGKLDLRALVRDLAPEIEFTNPWAATHPVTVAMVMEHTAGFDDIRFREYAAVDDPNITLQQGLAFNPSSRVSRWIPGTHMSYCNSGPPIAAYILQKITGQVFEDYVREHVFDVLGMEHSTYHFPENAALMAKGYEADGVTEAHYDHIIIRPSGALNSSSREMANYLRMMINRGTLDGVQLLRPETITRMETPTTTLAARAGYNFGYGLGNYSSVVAGHHFHGHDGGITGFLSTSAYSSELGVGYFVSINKPSGKVGDIAELLAEHLTAGIDPPEGATATLSDAELRDVAGFYQEATPRTQLMQVITRFLAIQRVTVEDGKLFIKPLIGGEKKRFIPVSSTSFRLEDQPVATMFRVADDTGEVFLQAGLRGNNEQVSAFSIFFQIGTLIATVLLLASSVLFAVVWVPLKVFGKLKRVPLSTVLFPLLATLSLLVAFVLPMMMSSDMVADLGNRSGVSLTIYIGSLVFAALTVFSLVTSFRSYSVDMSGLARVHSVLVSLACTVALLYLWSNDLIGLRTWMY